MIKSISFTRRAYGVLSRVFRNTEKFMRLPARGALVACAKALPSIGVALLASTAFAGPIIPPPPEAGPNAQLQNVRFPFKNYPAASILRGIVQIGNEGSIQGEEFLIERVDKIDSFGNRESFPSASFTAHLMPLSVTEFSDHGRPALLVKHLNEFQGNTDREVLFQYILHADSSGHFLETAGRAVATEDIMSPELHRALLSTGYTDLGEFCPPIPDRCFPGMLIGRFIKNNSEGKAGKILTFNNTAVDWWEGSLLGVLKSTAFVRNGDFLEMTNAVDDHSEILVFRLMK